MPFLTPDTPPANEYVCRRLRIPARADILSLVTGALASLLYEKNFESAGSMSPEDTAQMFKRMMLEMETTDCMIGEIKAFMRVTLPKGVLPCDGSIFNRVDYPELYNALPDDFIIDANQFQTPNLMKRGLVGWDDSADPEEYEIGNAIGTSFIQPTVDQLPAHSHTTQPHNHTDPGHTHTYNNSAGITIPVISPGEAVALTPNFIPGITNPATTGILDATVTVNETGEGEIIDVRNPDTVVLWGIVAL